MVDSSGSILVTYDPVTLERLSLQVTGVPKGTRSLTYGQGRLYSIETNQGVLMDQLVSWHPASGLAKTIGPTGVSYSNSPSIKYDAAGDRFFALYQENPTLLLWHPDLYLVDPSTGDMTFVARVGGGPQFFDFPTSMTIGPDGTAFVSQVSFGNQGPSIGILDLSTGHLDPLGRVALGIGFIEDMAFDGSGVLWALFDDFIDDSNDGLYTIDPVSMAFEPKIVPGVHPLPGMNSLAFVPLPPVSKFCSSTRGSSCSPALDWAGLPSASATSGFTVSVRGSPSASTGLMLWGPGGPSTPFSGSVLCFDPPYQSTLASASVSANTGSPCDGTWTVDLNPEILAAGVFEGGDTLRAQWMGFDPNSPASQRRVTSDALEFELAP